MNSAASLMEKKSLIVITVVVLYIYFSLTSMVVLELKYNNYSLHTINFIV